MPFDLKYEQLVKIFTNQKGSRDYFYEEACKKHEAFKPHSEGAYPEQLIEERRPNEPLEVKAYRRIIWKAITKPTFDRIINSLNKIRRSTDWTIKYPQEEFTLIKEEESLQTYCEEEFPYFGSVTNWLFNVMLRIYCADANALVLVRPIYIPEDETEYLEPFPEIFNSETVIKYEEDEYAILQDLAGCTYRENDGEWPGKAFWIVTKQKIIRYEQVSSKEQYAIASDYAHGLDILPCFKVGGIICKAFGHYYLYESRINGILPELDEAVREYSDTQAGKVLSIYPERWEYSTNECTNCKGTGQVRNPLCVEGCAADVPATIDCLRCEGVGYIAAGPYKKMLVKPSNVAEQTPPMPPAGYIQKDVEVVKYMDASVEAHIYKALSAINFQFLEQTPLNISGKGKEVDKDEVNNTVSSIAEDLVRIMDNTYKLIAYYRYKLLYQFDVIDEMLPVIPVPEKFDLLTTAYLQKEVTDAKTGKLNAVILNAMEIDYAAKRFNSDLEVYETVALTIMLDPLPNIAEDEKMSRLSNKGITQQAYVISSNINEFVRRAIEEDAKFITKTPAEQKEVMKKYADEIIQQTSAKSKVNALPTAQDTGIDPATGLPIVDNQQQQQQQPNDVNPAEVQ